MKTPKITQRGPCSKNVSSKLKVGVYSRRILKKEAFFVKPSQNLGGSGSVLQSYVVTPDTAFLSEVFSSPQWSGSVSCSHGAVHTPSITFRHLPPKEDVVNQCLEFERVAVSGRDAVVDGVSVSPTRL